MPSTDEWAARRRIRKLAAEIEDEAQLRRVLSDVSDPQLRIAVFKEIRPWLKFHVSYEMSLEGLGIPNARS